MCGLPRSVVCVSGGRIWSFNGEMGSDNVTPSRYGVEPSCERTYNGHRYPVFGLHPLNRSGQHIGSCDGSLHVWDIRTGPSSQSVA